MASKTYSFGVTIKTDPKYAPIMAGIEQEIQKAVKKASRDLAHSFFKPENVQLPRHVHEIVSCPDASTWEFDNHTACPTCYSRDRHPMPMSELYGLGKLIET